MSPEQFRQVEELYHAVCESTGEARVALLAQADPELRREVESLLRISGESGFLDRPALEKGADLVGESTVTSLTSGACLGPYRIESRLGAGGMGEVFRAVDTRLGRAVAVKTSHERFGVRFEREARAISSLNHPYICTLYDVGPNYIVMELVDGETIAARLKTGPLPWKTALLYATQIAAALVEAHAKGIVHRDLKPGNIMIAKSGVKVLDFGLAKSSTDDTVTATRMVIGTPAYMAPEQREGKPADERSDIYSFGCVLYEMLTGARIGSQRKRIATRRLEKIVNRCLEEEPGRRWHSAAELERELGKLIEPSHPWKVVAAAAVILAIAVGVYAYLHRAPRLTGQDTIVLADFDNKTGDPVFDDTLRQGLAVELQQSPLLSLLSETRIQRTLRLMGQPKDARLTPDIAQRICERTASSAILEGSIASLGSQYVLGLRARNCSTGGILDQEQIQAARREDVLNSLSQIARKFRTKVGESLATVEEYSLPLAEATTPSFEALQAYSNGRKTSITSGSATAIAFFRRAVELDPQFAMAYAHLGLSYSAIGESVLSAESTMKAWQLRDRVSDRERFFIDFTYDRQVTGNLEKAYQTLELWYQTYPRGEDPNALELFSGLSTHGTGRYERSIQAAQAKMASDPDFIFSYSGLAASYLFQDRFAEAAGVLRSAAERKLDQNQLLLTGYNIALLQGDKDEMDRDVLLAKGRHGVEHRLAHAESLALSRSGRLRAAREMSERAVALALQEGAREEAASYQAARGVWEAMYGDAVEGKKRANQALDLSKGRDVQYAAALALAFSGDSSRSQSLADDLERRFPDDTFVTFTYVPVLRALASLAQDKPSESVDHLQIALRYELAVNGLNFSHYYLGGLHSAYVRGEALMAEHKYAEAAAEFQKILQHRGLVGADPIGPLAQLQLGRLYVLAGDKPKAKAAYENFLTLWKDAGSDIEILKKAKSDHAKL